MVPRVGIEPTLPEGNGILNPTRLPIPPPRQIQEHSVFGRNCMRVMLDFYRKCKSEYYNFI
jgi:hypothetical protein